MKLKTLALAAALLALPALTFAAPITYPGSSATDSSTGAAVTSGVTAAVVSVTDLDGNAKATSLAAAHVAGGNTSAVYDAAANGEAWVTLTLTASGHTFSPVVIFCSVDPSTLASTNTNTGTLITGQASIKSDTTKIGTAAGQTATVSLSTGDETKIGLIGTDTPGITSLLTKVGAPAGASLAADIAAVKADTGGLASHQKGRFTYNPTTHSLQLLLDDGVTPFGAPLTLTVDTIGNTLSR